eukprot:SAG25_NODE_1773_length_2360_cov_2.922158_3_plen_36_part_00
MREKTTVATAIVDIRRQGMIIDMIAYDNHDMIRAP